MGFNLGGHPNNKTGATGPTGPSVGSFKLGGSHHGAATVSASSTGKKGGGLLGTIGHVIGQTGSDIGTQALGFIPGIVKAGETVKDVVAADVHQAIHHPTQTQSFSEFLHGKPGSPRAKLGALEAGVAKQTGLDLARPITHPSDPHLGNFALAALTAASVGAGGAARLGDAGRIAKAGGTAGDVAKALGGRAATRAELPIRSPRAAATGEGPVVTKLSETQPLVKGRQVFSNKALSRIKYTRSVIGEGARYGKEIRRTAVRDGLKEMPAYRTYVHATKKLNDHEWAALNLIPRDVHPADLAEYWKGTKNGEIAADPKVAALVVKPTKQLQAAVAAARNLSEQGAKVFTDLGLNASKDPALFRQRVGEKLGRDVTPLHGDPFYVPDVPRPTRTSDPFAAFGGGKGQPRIPGAAKQNKGVLQSLGKLNLQEDVLGPNFLNRVKLKTHAAVHQGLLDGAMKLTPHELDAVIAEHGGIPKGWDYVTAPTVTKTVERTVQLPPAEALTAEKVNAQLQRLGEDRPVDPTINPNVWRRQRDKLVALRDELQKTGPQEAPTTATVKQKVKLQTPTRKVGGTPQRIHPLNRAEAPTGAQPSDIAALTDNQQALGERLAQPLGTPDKAQAYFDGTHYYLAPKTTIRAATGEFHRSNAVVRNLIEKPLSTWRAIILGYRLGFLTNNVVGNNLLYGVRTAGIGGLRAYLNAVKEAKGPDVVKQLLEDKPTRAKLGERMTQQLMDEFFPEQVQGTFGRTQSPVLEGTITSARGRRIASKAKAGIIPATQAVAESLPRRALAETLIRNSPEFRRVYQAMPKQTRTFEAAARRTLEDPRYQRLISDQINRALGDYLNMGTFERETLRNIVPFYSWYKAIATITAHLAADTPGRALAVAQLGRIGDEWTQQALGPQPSYNRGAIPIGKPHAGIATILPTQGWNPYATLPQLARGVTTDVGNLGLSPQIELPLEAYAALKAYGGHGRAGLVQVLGSSAKSFLTGLPQARIIAPPPPSKLYPKQTRLTQVLSSAGVPIKKENLAEAAKRAKAGK